MAQRTPKDPLGEYRRKRDFSKTPEPKGAAAPAEQDGLRFVIQKHQASHLHYDLRLEMAGVMRSWAVPKGPSLDPHVRRLAMEVEDHPIEYNDFEGTIPAGEYGGGTVLLWDRGTYVPDEPRSGESAEAAALREYHAGKLSITLQGSRLRGSFALVRTDSVEGGVRSKWLLIKHRDEAARADSEITAEMTTSVATKRTMEEIAAGKGGERVWHSDREDAAPRKKTTRPVRRPAAAQGSPEGERLSSTLRPMLATIGDAVPGAGDWSYEPKYDGIRVLAFITPGGVALMTRNGNDKSKQFPEVIASLRSLVEALGEPLVLDGELVALAGGEIVRFGELQGRMHVQDRTRTETLMQSSPAGLVAFDLLLRGERILMQEPWAARRVELEEVLRDREDEHLRLSEISSDAQALLRRAARAGWEGVIAKRTESRYRPGQRSRDWLKLKLENRQEFAVGGWTEPRKGRPYLGALLLGYYDAEGRFRYAGHTGTGMGHRDLAELHRQLSKLERKTPPFTERPKTNEAPHWTTPRVVVEIRFNEWTREGKLRQPVFVGLREDKDAREVVREPATPVESEEADGKRGVGERSGKGTTDSSARENKMSKATGKEPDSPAARQLRLLQESTNEGELKLGRDVVLSLTNLDKVFFPKTGHTKGDLLLYYARMSPLILRWMKDRPLVLKRFPNGVEGESFYQQSAPESVPRGVRVETLPLEIKAQRRLIGGDLTTLLYTIQLGAVSYDPWHSRLGELENADYTILDLDPGPGADFRRVVEVASLIGEELERLGLHGGIKTSGSSGLHIYLPLPRGTPLESATLVARIVATHIAQKYPRIATVERMTKKRPQGTVYVDFLQNILGKTVAGVYAVRAKSHPMVSTPLSWDELTDSLEMASFTIDTLPERIARVGDLWTPLMKKGNPLSAILPKEGGETAARKPPAVKGSEATSSRSSAGKRTPRRKATPKSAKRGSPPPAAP